jgi:hypothetical protein
MRAEGLEPPSSFEHRHLKPACLPISPRPPHINSRAAEGAVGIRRHEYSRTYVRSCLRGGAVRSRGELSEALRLCQLGHSDREVEEQTGVPRRTVSDWRRGHGRTQFRLRNDPDDSCHRAHSFSELPPAPYAYLLGIYLGDGYISRGRRGVWRIRITLDSAYPEIISECCATLDTIFPGQHARPTTRRDSRCVDVSMWSKHWPCLIPQHGAGRKHLRPIRLLPWQIEIVEAQQRSFLRGLIHSDGTRIIATERKGSYVRRAPRYAFSNRSEDILRLFCESCDALGVDWTRPSDHQIAIYKLASVALLDEFVGPKR